MKLIEKKLSRKLNNYKEIKALIKRAFPKEERMPMWLIHILTLKKKYDFNVYYDNGIFVGIIFTIDSDDTLFVFYLAVNDKIQSKGYGSIILQSMIKKYENKSVTLFIETMDPTAQNYEQRVKRLRFYIRNGFHDTGIKAGAKKPFIDILSTDSTFDKAKSKRLFKFMPLKIFDKQSS